MGTLVLYIGDPLHPGTDPETVTAFGHTFPRGAWVEIDSYRYPEAARKLENNGHFAVLEGSGPYETLEPLNGPDDDPGAHQEPDRP